MNVQIMNKEAVGEFLKPRKIKSKMTNRKQSVQPVGATTGNQTPIIMPLLQQQQQQLMSINPTHHNSFLQTTKNSQSANTIVHNSSGLVNQNAASVNSNQIQLSPINYQMINDQSNSNHISLTPLPQSNASMIQFQMQQRKLVQSKEIKQRNQLLQNLMNPVNPINISNNNQMTGNGSVVNQQYNYNPESINSTNTRQSLQSQTPTRQTNKESQFKEMLKKKLLSKDNKNQTHSLFNQLTPTISQSTIYQQNNNNLTPSNPLKTNQVGGFLPNAGGKNNQKNNMTNYGNQKSSLSPITQRNGGGLWDGLINVSQKNNNQDQNNSSFFNGQINQNKDKQIQFQQILQNRKNAENVMNNSRNTNIITSYSQKYQNLPPPTSYQNSQNQSMAQVQDIKQDFQQNQIDNTNINFNIQERDRKAQNLKKYQLKNSEDQNQQAETQEVREISNNQKRREKQIVSPHNINANINNQKQSITNQNQKDKNLKSNQRENIVTQKLENITNGSNSDLTKEQRIKQMKEEIKNNELKLQKQMQNQIKSSQIQSHQVKSQEDLGLNTFTDIQNIPSQIQTEKEKKLQQAPNNSSASQMLISPYLQHQQVVINSSNPLTQNGSQNHIHILNHQIKKGQKQQNSQKQITNNEKSQQKDFQIQELKMQSKFEYENQNQKIQLKDLLGFNDEFEIKNLIKNKRQSIQNPQLDEYSGIYDSEVMQSLDNFMSPSFQVPFNQKILILSKISQSNLNLLVSIDASSSDRQSNQNIQGMQGESKTNKLLLNKVSNFQQEDNSNGSSNQSNIITTNTYELNEKQNNKGKAQRPQQFSFGQISPKFYKDQPAANLLTEEEYISIPPRMSSTFVLKPKKTKQNNEKINKSGDYLDLEDNEAQLIKSSNTKLAQKLMQSQQIKNDVKKESKFKRDSKMIDYSNADEIYNDLGDDLLVMPEEEIILSQGSRDFKSRGSLSNELMGSYGVPQNMRRIRLESFAKTPYFLKSPRSMASSQLAGNDLFINDNFNEQQFLSLNTYNGDQANDQIELAALNKLNNLEGKRNLGGYKHIYKLSQSSDEIARTVNIFFEKKEGILDNIPTQNKLLAHGYSPLMFNQNRLQNTNIIITSSQTNGRVPQQNQMMGNNIYIDPSKINQLQIFNNSNIQMPVNKLLKNEKGQSKKGKFKMMRMNKPQTQSHSPISNHESYNWVNQQDSLMLRQQQIMRNHIQNQYSLQNYNQNKANQMNLLRVSIQNGGQIENKNNFGGKSIQNLTNREQDLFENDKITHDIKLKLNVKETQMIRDRSQISSEQQIMRKNKMILLSQQQQLLNQ